MTVSKLFESIRKCQIQLAKLSYVKEFRTLIINYKNLGSFARNVRIIWKPFLKIAADRLFLKVAATFKYFE